MRTQREIEELARDSRLRGWRRDADQLREELKAALSEDLKSPGSRERVELDLSRAAALLERLDNYPLEKAQ